MEQHLEITWASLWRILAFVLALIGLYLIRDILILLALAVVISAICLPFVGYLVRKKVNRFLATSLVFVLIVAILAVFLWLVVPLVIYQFGNFIANFNETISKAGANNFLADLVKQFILNLRAAFDVLAKGATAIFNLIFSIFGGIFLTLTCLVLAFYLTAEEKGIEKFFRILLPKSYENRVIAVISKSTHRIGRWFQGRLVVSIIVGLLTWIGLYLLGINYSGTLALLSGVLSNVPLVGPFFAGLMASIVALTESWPLAVWTAVLFIIIHQLEGIFLMPLIMKRIAGLPALAVLLAILIGTKLAGLVGFLLAVPAAIVGQEIFENHVRRRNQV